MYNLKKLLTESDKKINRKKPFSLSPNDPYMYYWETTGQQDNPQGGVWMSKKKNTTMEEEPWYDLSVTLSPAKYAAANKLLGANPLSNTAYQLDWSGEGDYSAVNTSADVNKTEKDNYASQYNKMHGGDKIYNLDQNIKYAKGKYKTLNYLSDKTKYTEAGQANSTTVPKILGQSPSGGWLKIEIPWGSDKQKKQFYTRAKWFTDGTYNFKDGKRSYKVYYAK